MGQTKHISTVERGIREHEALVRKVRALALALDLIGEVSLLLEEHSGFRTIPEMANTEDLMAVYEELRNRARKLPVNRAAHLFSCFYACRATELCREEGLTDDQITRGAWLAEQRRDVRSAARAYYGDPAYGSWPAEAGDWMRNELAERGASVTELVE